MSTVETDTKEPTVQVFLYGRISVADDDNGDETSLPNQREMMKEFAAEENLSVEGWFYDRNTSGATYPFARDGFGEMVEALRTHENVTTILIKNGKRIARGESAEDIKKELKGNLGREIEIIKTHPEEMEKLEEEVPDFLKPTVEGARKTHERLAIEEARQAGKLTYQRKKQAGELCHRPPRGLTSNGDGGFEPIEEYYDDDAKRVRHKEFETVIEMLNEIATTEKSPGKVADDYGLPSPWHNGPSMWERRDLYRTMAMKHSSHPTVEF